ncbi:MAG: hypothetical protein GEV11_12190 [Streptosporangiales bacterium]|nr:hypothetical protein [Streptosporangiales bacterium]
MPTSVSNSVKKTNPAKKAREVKKATAKKATAKKGNPAKNVKGRPEGVRDRAPGLDKVKDATAKLDRPRRLAMTAATALVRFAGWQRTALLGAGALAGYAVARARSGRRSRRSGKR